MKEIEKRLGLDYQQSSTLKDKLNSRLSRESSIARTVLVNVNGDGFTPDPEAMTDVKVKLIGEDSILSIKYGSWHGDALREEYDINFRRSDLANVIGGVSVVGSDKFILLSTLRTTWRDGDLMHTLDEYGNVGQSLFEVEASGSFDETHVDQAFTRLGVMPMDSAETVNFINAINQHPATRIDLAMVSAQEVARQMLEVHSHAS